MKKQDYINRYGVEAYERHLEQARQRYAENREKRAAYDKQRYAERKEQILEQKKQYYSERKKEKAEYMKQYNVAHKEQRVERNKQYYATPIGRANSLAGVYRSMDKKKGFLNVENQVDSNFIINNIFNSSCIYCGESDWTKLGCDRIDNSKPHTIDNVVCCCGKCNVERNAMNFDEFMAMNKEEDFIGPPQP